MEGIWLAMVCVCQLVGVNVARGLGARSRPVGSVHNEKEEMEAHYSLHDGLSPHSLNRRHSSTSPLTNSAHLHALSNIDPVVAHLEYIDIIRRNTSQCSKDNNIAIPFPDPHERFKTEAKMAESLATILSNYFAPQFGIKEAKTYYNNAIFYSFAKFVVTHNSNISGCGIAFDESKYVKQKYFIPYAYTDSKGVVQIKDLSVSLNGSYTKNGTKHNEWFWGVKFSKATRDLINKYSKANHTCIELCTTAKTSEKRIKESRVKISKREGRWSNVKFDCDGKKKWLLTYSVPFIACTEYCFKMGFT